MKLSQELSRLCVDDQDLLNGYSFADHVLDLLELDGHSIGNVSSVGDDVKFNLSDDVLVVISNATNVIDVATFDYSNESWKKVGRFPQVIVFLLFLEQWRQTNDR